MIHNILLETMQHFMEEIKPKLLCTLFQGEKSKQKAKLKTVWVAGDAEKPILNNRTWNIDK